MWLGKGKSSKLIYRQRLTEATLSDHAEQALGKYKAKEILGRRKLWQRFLTNHRQGWRSQASLRMKLLWSRVNTQVFTAPSACIGEKIFASKIGSQQVLKSTVKFKNVPCSLAYILFQGFFLQNMDLRLDAFKAWFLKPRTSQRLPWVAGVGKSLGRSTQIQLGEIPHPGPACFVKITAAWRKLLGKAARRAPSLWSGLCKKSSGGVKFLCSFSLFWSHYSWKCKPLWSFQWHVSSKRHMSCLHERTNLLHWSKYTITPGD